MLFLRCYYNTHLSLVSLFHTTNKQSPRKISNINVEKKRNLIQEIGAPLFIQGPPPKKIKIKIKFPLT